MTRRLRRHRAAAGLWAWCCLLGLALMTHPAYAQSAWELTPYRVRVCLAADGASGVSPAIAARLAAELAQQVDAYVGAAWHCTVELVPPDLAARLPARPEDLADNAWPEHWFADEVDKVLLLAIRRQPGGWLAAARQFDVRTQITSAAVQRRVAQQAALPSAAFRTVVEAFAPLARIVRVDGDQATLALRGSSLDPRAADLSPGPPAAVFLPIVRYNDIAGRAQRIEPLPWTFLEALEAAGPFVQCRIWSGIRQPLSGRRRGRVEYLALAVQPQSRPTLLTLLSTAQPPQPLVGYQVVAHRPGQRQTVPLGRTDHRGQLAVDGGDGPLRLLLVLSGAETVARLPLVTGLSAELTARIAPDDLRLQVEGQVTGIQERFVDYVARRRVLAARIEVAAADGDNPLAQRLLEQYDALGTPQQFASAVRQLQQRSVAGDPITQAKIDRLLGDTLTVIERLAPAGNLEQLRPAIVGGADKR